MCGRLGWDMHLHQLRHYSATELIAAGVDVRTVASRLGHGGGGATTLKVYSAWRSEADQRAASSLGLRMPAPPMEVDPATPITGPSLDDDRDATPQRRITADLRGAIACGAFQPGDVLPTLAEIARRYDVATSTVRRSFATLKDAGLINVTRGWRAVVSPRLEAAPRLARLS